LPLRFADAIFAVVPVGAGFASFTFSLAGRFAFRRVASVSLLFIFAPSPDLFRAKSVVALAFDFQGHVSNCAVGSQLAFEKIVNVGYRREVSLGSRGLEPV
jgi:hypothetical protein